MPCSFWGWRGGVVFFYWGGDDFYQRARGIFLCQNVRGVGLKESTLLIHFVLKINTTDFPSPTQVTQDVTNDQSLYMAKHFRRFKRNL